MADLVIVESPTKARTIERYLGAGYTVAASYGHVRDLPRSEFGVEVHDGECRLHYEVSPESRKRVEELKRAARTADRVWLALDLDREGEAIAWHVAELLGLDLDTDNRVTFDEITEDAIRRAFTQPRRLNLALVDAQQARRAVDRIVGYRLSPVLWRTVAAGISAGRVQSVALRLIVDREEEIRAFVPQAYWTLHAELRPEGREGTVQATLVEADGRRVVTPRDGDADEPGTLLIDRAELADELVARAQQLTYRVAAVRRSQVNRTPPPPFTTSTLQQEAARKLGFSAARTMQVAQQLYEGVELGAEGPVGLITYMRTDSVHIADSALRELTAVVAERFGPDYRLAEPRRYRTRTKGAQEAHEAIRPTSARRHPDDVRRYLTRDQARLYELIWRRTVATQMAPARFDRLSADIDGSDGAGVRMRWRVTGQVLRFDGFLAVYQEGRDDDGDEEAAVPQLPDLSEGETLAVVAVRADEHTTQPPPRYSEATLVKELEADGIGRPSTYATIIQTLKDRGYVEVRDRRFHPTPLGEVVAWFLKRHFGEVVDVGFTARMEETLDEIAAGRAHWCATVAAFLEEVDRWVRERKPERPRLPLDGDVRCPECGAPMERVFSGRSKRWFASCTRWPDCEGTLPLDAEGQVRSAAETAPDPEVPCPECGKPMLLRDGRYGRFFGCVDYPRCKGVRNVQRRAVYLDSEGDWQPLRSPTDPDAYLEVRTGKQGKPFVGSARYPEDRFAVWTLPLAEPCPRCGAPLRPPARNRKVVTCTHPELVHRFELDDADPPRLRSIEVVPGVAAYDPDLGGDPLDGWPEPYTPLALRFVDEGPPPPRRSRRTRSGG